MHVIVVGAGIIGASIAWTLSRAGAQVTVIDGGQPAASQASFGWINASFYADAAHHRLRVAGLAAYEILRAACPDVPIIPCGALWWEDQGPALHDMKNDLQDHDYPVEYLPRAEAEALEPDLLGLPQDVLRFPSELAADASRVASQLISEAKAQVIRGVTVQGILGAEHVTGIDTSIGPISADRVVIAAGNGAPDILASVDVALPMLTRPGVLVTTTPTSARIGHILVTPHGEARQLPDGRILASAAANHQGDDASVVTEPPADIAARVLGWLNPMIKGPALALDTLSLAYRPMPQDGLPVIGAVGPKGLHVAVMHSGVTLAAIVGQVTAAEVLGQGSNSQSDIVAPYRPDRFQ